MGINIRVCMHVCTCMRVCMCVRYVCARRDAGMGINIRVCMHVCMYVFVCVCIYIYIHINTYICDMWIHLSYVICGCLISCKRNLPLCVSKMSPYVCMHVSV
jgi:hypothetical protein